MLFWHMNKIALLILLLSLITSVHAILRRRDPRATVAWLLTIWFLPPVGSILYWLIGINRIERKATRLRRSVRLRAPFVERRQHPETRLIEPTSRNLHVISRLVEGVTHTPLTPGNIATPLPNGDTAYPAMLKAIGQAHHSVGLSTYIFNDDEAGKLFVEALTGAAQRGVQVRVLIDDVGSGFFRSGVRRKLEEKGVTVAYFLPTLVPWRTAYFNLRNHRKLLIIDGRIGFTGGINIHEGHLLEKLHPRNPTKDIHFQIQGPVVAQMQETFRMDWHFTTDEWLQGQDWFPDTVPSGTVKARGIPGGPDEDFEKTRWAILGALGHAEKHIRIATPYFLPDSAMISALNVAAMSGVTVDVVLPEFSDLALVNWASEAMHWQILKHGVRIWRTPRPFDHTKIMTVDGGWCLIGSSNWDARSLRLNFEFDIECYDETLAGTLEKLVDTRIAQSRRITFEEADSRPLPAKFRDGLAWLAAPFL